MPPGTTIPAATVLKLTITNIPLPGAPSLQSSTGTARFPSAERTGLVTVELTFTNSVTLLGGPSFDLTVPVADILDGTVYYFALYDPTNADLGWQLGFEGPAAVVGSTLIFVGASASVTLAANVTYEFALYGVSVAAPSPTPAPVPTPAVATSPSATGPGGGISFAVPTPAPVLCLPSPIVVSVQKTVVVDCRADGYFGPFTWTVGDPSIASVQQYNAETQMLFNVTGLRSGATSLTLLTRPQGSGTVSIQVNP